ncbi:MAG TPA: PAS domain S-box protein [Gemmatimonadaceae bacterium]
MERVRIRTPLARYSFALAMVAAGLALRLLLTPLTGRGAPFVVFFGATLVTSLVAGVGPALLSVATSVPLAVLLFVLPAGYPMHQAVFQAALYAGDGLIIVYMTILIRRTQARAADAIELAPDAYFLSDLSARFTDVNRKACRLLGYERNELVGKTIFDLIPSDQAARLEEEKRTLLTPGTVLTTEWTLKRKDGAFVPVEVSANILQDGRWQAFVRDITERRRAQARLRESEERFRLTIDNAPIGMALVALDGRFQRVNHVLCEITGYPAAELTRLSFQDITHPDDLATDVDAARRLAVGEIPRYQREKRYIRKDGSIVDIMLSTSILRDPDGSAVSYITQMEDITARKRAESALRLSEAKFSGIVSIAADAIITVDAQQRITIFNEGAERIFGYAKNEIIGRPLEQLIPERFRVVHRAHFARFAASSDAARTMGERSEIFGLRKSGDEFPAEASIARVTAGNTTFFFVVLRDITTRKADEEALKRAIVARDEVLGFVAHDLRNPLGAILMQAALLERVGPDPERRDQKAKELIIRSAKRMNRLIQDLLDVATIEAGRLKLESTRVSASELVREAVEAQATHATAANVNLRLDVPYDVPAIWADRDRLLQVFENLVGNAIKFTPAGGRITVAAASQNTQVLFSVADTGAGIAQDSLAHIFDPFWQAATREQRLGAGLGLPITRGIVEAHGGELWVESQVGQGSTFFFTIPMAGAESGSRREPRQTRTTRVRRAKR